MQGVARHSRQPILEARFACGVVLLFLWVCAPALAAPTTKVPTLTLVYDRTPAVCHYLLHLYNRDLARKGYVDTRTHRVFRTIHWSRLKGPLVVHGSVVPPELATVVRIASFDLTNSGHPVHVARALDYIGHDATAVESLTFMDRIPKDLQQWVRWGRVLHGHIRPGFPPTGPAVINGLYLLTHAPTSWVAPRGWPYRDPVIPLIGLALDPLRYRGVFYLSMGPYADHGRLIVGGPYRRWIVIGTFRPHDEFEDTCYFREGAFRPAERSRVRDRA